MTDAVRVRVEVLNGCPATLLAFLIVDLEELRPDLTMRSDFEPPDDVRGVVPFLEFTLPAEPPRYSLPGADDNIRGLLADVEAKNLVSRELVASLNEALDKLDARCRDLDQRDRVIAGLNARIAELETVPTPTELPPVVNAPPRIRCDVPGCGQEFLTPGGLGIHRHGHEERERHRRSQEAREQRSMSAREVAQPERIVPGSLGLASEQPAVPDLAPDGDEPVGDAITTPQEPSAAVNPEVAAVLDHPEWIDGAVQRSTGAWVRDDGGLWECSCGRKVGRLSQLRAHVKAAGDLEAHRPLVTVDAEEQREGVA